MATNDQEGYRPRRRRSAAGFAPGEPTPGQGWPVTSQAPPVTSQGQSTEYVQPFSYEAPRYQGYGSFRGRVQPYEVSQAPGFYVDPFRYPSGEDVFEDPSYQFRLNEGLKALERSAAARGTLRSGNTLQDLMRYGQDYAASEYGAAAQRAQEQYDRNLQASQLMYLPEYQTWSARNQAGMSAWEQQNLLRQQEEQRRWMEYQFRLDDEWRREQEFYRGGLGTF